MFGFYLFGGLLSFILFLSSDCIKEKGVPGKVYVPFALTLAAFCISVMFSMTAAAVILMIASVAVIFRSLKNTVSVDFICIITAIALISSGYHLYDYVCSFPKVEYDSWWLRTLLISTFLQFIFLYEKPLIASGVLKTCIYTIIFYAILWPMTIGMEIEDKCRDSKYADGKIIFCAKVTEREYDQKKKEYNITTDYLLPDSSFFCFKTDMIDGAQIAVGQQVVLERAYYDANIYSDVDLQLMPDDIKEFEQPVVEKGGRRSKLAASMDTAFFNHNMNFVCKYCGFYVVYKADKKGVTYDGKLQFEVVGRPDRHMIFQYKPSTGDDRYHINTLLFSCNVDSCHPRDLTCLDNKMQFSKYFDKITDYGYLFREGLFSSQEYEHKYPQIKEFTSVFKP